MSPTTSEAEKVKDIMNVGKKGSIDVTDKTPSTVADIDIPTRMDIFYDLNGSLGFAIGSSGFIFAMYYDDWLPYFRYGSLIWIWGCIFYCIPLFLKLKGGKDRCPWDLADLGVFLCCLFYTIGCIFGGFFGLATVEKYIMVINHTFLYGSLSLAIEPSYEGYLLIVMGGSFMSRMRRSKLFGSPCRYHATDTNKVDLESDSRDDDESNEICEVVNEHSKGTPLRLNWDRFFELGAMFFFIAAGAFGGFPPHDSWALPGQYFWEVGSLFAVGRSIVMIYRRKEGLLNKQFLEQQQANAGGRNRRFEQVEGD